MVLELTPYILIQTHIYKSSKICEHMQVKGKVSLPCTQNSQQDMNVPSKNV